jgi:hypothetical protein
MTLPGNGLEENPADRYPPWIVAVQHGAQQGRVQVESHPSALIAWSSRGNQERSYSVARAGVAESFRSRDAGLDLDSGNMPGRIFRHKIDFLTVEYHPLNG